MVFHKVTALTTAEHNDVQAKLVSSGVWVGVTFIFSGLQHSTFKASQKATLCILEGGAGVLFGQKRQRRIAGVNRVLPSAPPSPRCGLETWVTLSP